MSSFVTDKCLQQLKFLINNYELNFKGSGNIVEYTEVLSNYIFDNNIHTNKRYKNFNMAFKQKLIDIYNETQSKWIPQMFQKLFNEEFPNPS